MLTSSYSLGNVFYSNHLGSHNFRSFEVCDELGTQKFSTTKAFSRVFKRFLKNAGREVQVISANTHKVIYKKIYLGREI